MTIAHRIEDYMMQYGVQYDVVTHPHSRSSTETAELAQVPGDRLAKSVVLQDEEGYLMAVLPSTRHVRLGRLSRELSRRFRLATEVFRPFDCNFNLRGVLIRIDQLHNDVSGALIQRRTGEEAFRRVNRVLDFVNELAVEPAFDGRAERLNFDVVPAIVLDAS